MFGDLSDEASARLACEFAVYLADAEIGGGGEGFDLSHYSLWNGWASEMLASCLCGSHTGCDSLADEG